MTTPIVYFQGRPDGIGNRIEQLINIQEYCKHHNVECIYIWNNNVKRRDRTYDIKIAFDCIKIVKRGLIKGNKNVVKPYMRTHDYVPTFTFLFDPPPRIKKIAYDVIIHIRGTDRLKPNIKHNDFSNIRELNDFINKTIKGQSILISKTQLL